MRRSILEVWRDGLQDADLVCLRHGKKVVSTTSTAELLSKREEENCRKLNQVLASLTPNILQIGTFYATSHSRTQETLKLIFGTEIDLKVLPELNYPRIGEPTKREVTKVMVAYGMDPQKGRNRVFLQLEELGGSYPEEHPWRELAPRMAEGFRLIASDLLPIYCGHSPAIELGLLEPGQSPDAIGGLLGDLETLFLRRDGQGFKILYRLNPLPELGF